MMRSPQLYGVPVDYATSDDKYLEGRRSDLIHTAAVLLDKNNMIRYDRKSGNFQVSLRTVVIQSKRVQTNKYMHSGILGQVSGAVSNY